MQIDQIEIASDGCISFRKKTVEVNSGIEKTIYSRTTIPPGFDITGYPEEIVSVCASVWNDEVIAIYNTKITQISAMV